MITPKKNKAKRNKEKRKKEILDVVKRLGRVPISKFVAYLSLHYDSVIKYVDELVVEKKVIKEVETNATYIIENKKANNSDLGAKNE